jgi:hypothetical protein
MYDSFVLDFLTGALIGAAVYCMSRLLYDRLIKGSSWGACLRCRRSWKYREHHTTWFKYEEGCFPLCERCWRKLGTPEARLPYYRTLWEGWNKTYPGYHDSDEWEKIKQAVMNGL